VKRMDFQLLQLRCFVAVAEELHFGRAALRLDLSQPQVSRHVRALEDALGVALFVRSARQTRLTDAGAALLQDARETLAAAERLRTRAAATARDATGHVTVGFVWSTLRGYLPPLVAAVAERHPETELIARQLPFVEIVPSLRRGDVDLVITRRVHERSEMVEELLMTEPVLLAIPAEHPFAERQRVLLAELHDEPMIALRRSLAPRAYDAVLSAARDRGLRLRIVREVASAGEALALVSVGVGVYRIPASAAIAHDGVVYRQLADARSRVMVMRRPEPPSPALAAVQQLARTLFCDADNASQNGRGVLEVVPAAT
jgi:DNA-binding transcriptional LysR family regulator